MMTEQESGDARAVMVEWLEALKVVNWKRMSELSQPARVEMIDPRILADNFKHRRIIDFDPPQFKEGNRETLDEGEEVGFVDFAVTTTLINSLGRESFVARVVLVGESWRVNVFSTMKRTTERAGKGKQCQRSQRARS